MMRTLNNFRIKYYVLLSLSTEDTCCRVHTGFGCSRPALYPNLSSLLTSLPPASHPYITLPFQPLPCWWSLGLFSHPLSGLPLSTRTLFSHSPVQLTGHVQSTTFLSLLWKLPDGLGCTLSLTSRIKTFLSTIKYVINNKQNIHREHMTGSSQAEFHPSEEVIYNWYPLTKGKPVFSNGVFTGYIILHTAGQSHALE